MKRVIGMLMLGMLAAMMAPQAQAVLYTIDAKDNSSSGGAGTGLDTGIFFNAGDTITISVDPNDLWSSGALPRWSNADGLDGNLFATGTDESGQAAGTLIGMNHGMYTYNGFSAYYGTLVGEIAGTFFTIGTTFNAAAPATGTLKLYYWDSNNFDNTEWVNADLRANIEVPVPEPMTLSLIGIGMAGLALRRRIARS